MQCHFWRELKVTPSQTVKNIRNRVIIVLFIFFKLHRTYNKKEQTINDFVGVLNVSDFQSKLKIILR